MAESASSASLGPRYAPEDPTLPKPWMGLIDGSTGLQYYWNPESNVTQYERPTPSTPPLPPGPPPATTPNLSPLPVIQNAQQPNGSEPYASQQMFQQTGQPVQFHDRQIQHPQSDVQLQSMYPRQQSFSYQGNQLYQQSEQQPGQSLPNGSQPPLIQSVQIPDRQIQHSHSDVPLPSKYACQQSYSYQGNQLKYLQSEQQSGQILQQISQQPGRELHHQYPGEQLSHQQPGQQLSEHTGQQYSHQMSGQQLSRQQSGQHASYQQPGPHVLHQQSSQNILQQIPYQQIPYQQAQQPPGQQIVQNIPQGGFPKVDDFSFPQGKKDVYTTSESHPSRGISTKPAGLPQVQPPHSGVHPSNHQDELSLPGGSQLSSTSYTHLQKNIETVPRQHQQIGTDSRPTNQMVPRNTDYVIPLRPPVALEYEDENQRRAGGDFYNRSKEVPGTSMLQPKLAAIPVARNLQETRAGAANAPLLPPGHPTMFNMPPAHHMSNMYENAVAVQPFPNGVPTESSPEMRVPSNLSHVSAADAYRNQHEVTTTGENIPAPFMTFEATGFPLEILREMHFAGFTSPTPIQAQTWSIALQGRDIVAIAKTGSGKTLGYLVPAFLHLRQFRDNRQIGPSAVVLAPTRELAVQIQDEAIKFGRSLGISSICLYGGAPKGPQLREIERGADIVVATPGRLNDFLEMSKINLRQVSFLVLDEADRMLDMGFEPQIRKIVDEVPRRRQTLMYTATWPKEVRKIAGDLLVNPVQVSIGSIDELAANKSITQYVEVLSPMDKQRRLEQILQAQDRGSKIIIFCSTKKLCDQLARGIGRSFGAIAIHGDKSQGERDWALNQFRTGKLPILVATDVAARGLDIKDIRVVINFDFPTGIEDYVHRIGRTGRAGATGVSYTFFSDQDWKFAADLIKVLEGANQRVPIEVREMAARGAPAFSKGRGGRWDSGGGRWNSGGGRGMRDGGVPGDSFGGRGERSDFMGGRTNRGRGFGGPGGWGRGGRGPHDRYGHMDGRGGRFDNQRQIGFRNRVPRYSRSPERGRNWRSRSPRSRSRSRSRSWSRSRSRSYSRSYSRSRSNSRSRSRSRSLERYDGRKNQSTTNRVSGFDVLPATGITNPPPRDVLPTSLDITGTNNSLNTDSIVHMEPASVSICASASEEPNPS